MVNQKFKRSKESDIPSVLTRDTNLEFMAPERITFDMMRLSLLFVAVISVQRNQALLPALNLGNFYVGPKEGITLGYHDKQVIVLVDASPVHPIR